MATYAPVRCAAYDLAERMYLIRVLQGIRIDHEPMLPRVSEVPELASEHFVEQPLATCPAAAHHDAALWTTVGKLIELCCHWNSRRPNA